MGNELLPLPQFDPLADGVAIYTKDHMHAYGRACRAPLLAEIERLKDRSITPEAVNAFQNAIRIAEKRAEAAERELAEVRQRNEHLCRGFGVVSEWDKLYAERADAINERDSLRAQLEAIRAIVNEQAEDDGLWFVDPHTAPEAYLQQELRRLHAAVEGAVGAVKP